jgi:hypothetical protein
MYCVSPEERGPGEDQFRYTAEHLLWCPWCGECLCYDDGEPIRGDYVTSEGERVEYPPETWAAGSEMRAYHRECHREKQCERHKALNTRLTYFEEEIE